MSALVFPPPLEQPVKQFVGQCESFCSNEKSLSEKFVALLHCSNPSVSSNARGLLVNVSQFPENKEAIRELGLLSCLIETLDATDNSNPLQLAVVAGLGNITSDNEANQVALSTTSFLRIISERFASFSGDTEEQVLRILMNISKNQSANTTLIPYTSLIRSIYTKIPSAATKTYSLPVEYSLSIGVGLSEIKGGTGAALLHSAEIGDVLVDYLSSPVLALRLYALQTCKNLIATSNEWCTALLVGETAGVTKGGFLGALIPQLRSKNESIQQKSLFIFKEVALKCSSEKEASQNQNQNRMAMATYGPHFIPILLSLMKDEDATKSKIAYIIMTELLNDDVIQDQFVKERGVTQLINVAEHSSSQEVALAASALLSYLLHSNEKALSHFIEEGELERLATSIYDSSSNVSTQGSLLGVVSNILLCSEDLREQFFQSAQCMNLSKCLSSPDEICQRNILRVMVNLTLTYQNIPLLLEEQYNVIPQAITLLQSNTEVERLVLSLLVNLTSHEQSHNEIIKDLPDGLNFIGSLLQSSCQEKKLSGLKLLTNFATTGRNRKWVHEESSFLSIIDSLQAHPYLSEQAESARANLSFPYEAHYDTIEVEKTKELLAMVELEEEDEEEFDEEYQEGDILHSQEANPETQEVSPDTQEMHSSPKEVEGSTSAVVVDPNAIRLEAQKEGERKIMEEQRIKLLAEVEEAEKAAAARELEERKEEQLRIEKQKEDEARLELIKKEEEAMRRAEEARVQKQKQEENEICEREKEAEVLRAQLAKEEEEKKKEQEIRQEKINIITSKQGEHKEKSIAEDSALAQCKADVATQKELIVNIDTRVESALAKKESRQRKVSRSLQRTEKSQAKLNQSLEKGSSSPKLSTSHSSQIEKTEEATKALARAEKKHSALLSERELALQQLQKLESTYESMIDEHDTARTKRTTELARLQQEIDGTKDEEASNKYEEQRKKRETQIAELQKERENWQAAAAAKREEEEKRFENFQREKNELQQKIEKQKQEEIIIRTRNEEKAVEEARKRDEAKKAAEDLKTKQRELEEQVKEVVEEKVNPVASVTPVVLATPVVSMDDEKRRKLVARRGNIVREIYDTEKTYVTSIRTLVWKFQKPLEQHIASGKKPAFVTREDIRILFSNAELILNFNKILFEGIEQRLKNWSDTQCLGDIFMKLTDFLRIYVDYVNNVDAAMKLVDKYEKKEKNKEFMKFLAKTEKVKACRGLSFESFLIMPIQRVPRYVMLLSDLLKNTWEDHPDYEALSGALARMKITGNFINDSKRNAECMDKMHSIFMSLTGRVPDALIQPHRKFIQEGNVKLLGGGKFSSARVYHLILLSDLLLITRPTKHELFDTKHVIGLQFISLKKLEGKPEILKLTSLMPATGASKKTKKCEFTFSCSSEKECDTWFSSIYRSVDKLTDDNHSFVRKQSSLGGISRTK